MRVFLNKEYDEELDKEVFWFCIDDSKYWAMPLGATRDKEGFVGEWVEKALGLDGAEHTVVRRVENEEEYKYYVQRYKEEKAKAIQAWKEGQR